MRIIILSLSFIIFSCNEKLKETNKCKDLARKYDSLTRQNADFHTSTFYKFHEIYKSEKGNLLDTLLIPKYRSISIDDEVVKVYIDNRIETIYNKKILINVLDKFQGKFTLSATNQNIGSADVTSVVIKRDSCYLYKNNTVVKSSKIKLINSSGGLTKAMFYIDNRYLVNLFADEFILVKDNTCLHCRPLHFNR